MYKKGEKQIKMATKKVILNGETIIDLSDTTATENTVASGYKFYDAHGNACYGMANFNSGGSDYPTPPPEPSDYPTQPSNNYNTELNYGSSYLGLKLNISNGFYERQITTQPLYNGYSGSGMIRDILGSQLKDMLTNGYNKLASISETGNVIIEDSSICSQFAGMNGEVHKYTTTTAWGSNKTIYYSEIEYIIKDSNDNDIEEKDIDKEKMYEPIYYVISKDDPSSKAAFLDDVEHNPEIYKDIEEAMGEAENLKLYIITFREV